MASVSVILTIAFLHYSNGLFFGSQPQRTVNLGRCYSGSYYCITTTSNSYNNPFLNNNHNANSNNNPYNNGNNYNNGYNNNYNTPNNNNNHNNGDSNDYNPPNNNNYNNDNGYTDDYNPPNYNNNYNNPNGNGYNDNYNNPSNNNRPGNPNYNPNMNSNNPYNNNYNTPSHNNNNGYNNNNGGRANNDFPNNGYNNNNNGPNNINGNGQRQRCLCHISGYSSCYPDSGCVDSMPPRPPQMPPPPGPSPLRPPQTPPPNPPQSPTTNPPSTESYILFNQPQMTSSVAQFQCPDGYRIVDQAFGVYTDPEIIAKLTTIQGEMVRKGFCPGSFWIQDDGLVPPVVCSAMTCNSPIPLVAPCDESHGYVCQKS